MAAVGSWLIPRRGPSVRFPASQRPIATAGPSRPSDRCDLPGSRDPIHPVGRAGRRRAQDVCFARHCKRVARGLDVVALDALRASRGATLERRITLAHRPYGSGGPRSLGVGSRPSSSRASSRIVSCLRPDLHPGSALLLPIEIVGAFELRRRAPTRAGRGDGECSRPDHERDAGPPGERTQRVPSAEARGVRCSVEHARPGPGLRCPGPIVGVRTDGRGLGYNRG